MPGLFYCFRLRGAKYAEAAAFIAQFSVLLGREFAS
jgi:hypothetical protein